MRSSSRRAQVLALVASRWNNPIRPTGQAAGERPERLGGSDALNPAQASAYATLSHLYINVPGKTQVDVVYAANKALETDRVPQATRM